jgi:hypothetical protein
MFFERIKRSGRRSVVGETMAVPPFSPNKPNAGSRWHMNQGSPTKNVISIPKDKLKTSNEAERGTTGPISGRVDNGLLLQPLLRNNGIDCQRCDSCCVA